MQADLSVGNDEGKQLPSCLSALQDHLHHPTSAGISDALLASLTSVRKAKSSGNVAWAMSGGDSLVLLSEGLTASDPLIRYAVESLLLDIIVDPPPDCQPLLPALATRLSAMLYPRPAAASLIRKLLKHARREGDDDTIWTVVEGAVGSEWMRDLMKSAWSELSPVEAHALLALMHGIVKTARHPDTPPHAKSHLMGLVNALDAHAENIARQLRFWRPYVRRRAIDLLAALAPTSLTALRALTEFLRNDAVAPAAWTQSKNASSSISTDETTEFCELEDNPVEEREATRTAILALLHATARSDLPPSDVTAIRALILSPQFSTALSLFSDNDVQLCTALADLVQIHRRAPLPAQLSPHTLFANNFGSDHALLVDLVLADASAIDYLLAYLRFAQEDMNDAKSIVNVPATTRELLSGLVEAVGGLVRDGLFPFDASPLVRRAEAVLAKWGR